MDRPFVFGVDLDGVCADYHLGFGRYVARRKGRNPADVPELHDYHNFAPWGIDSREEFTQLHADAVADGLFERLPLISGASDTLWRLSDEGVWIRVITHRLFRNGLHQQTVASTISWLDGHSVEQVHAAGRDRPSLIPYRDLCFIGDKPDVGADIYIDDAPSNVAPLRAAGGRVIVFDQPYNRTLPGPRATSWDQVYDLVMAAKTEAAAGT